MRAALAGATPRPSVFWSAGFRPFFLAAGVHAACAIPLWLLALAGIPSPVDLALHRHEMLFGYAGAVIAGFLLTAIPNWTQRPLLRGRPLMLLFGAWCVGRGGMLQVPGSTIVAALGDAAFFWGLVIYAWREIRLAGNRRGIPVCLLATALATADTALHFGLSHVAAGRTAATAGLAAIALLITLIGGRIVPAFTQNWLSQQGHARKPADFPLGEWQILALTAAALACWVAGLDARVAAAGLAAVALLHAVRLAGWHGLACAREPLVLVLHIGYAWLVAGLALLAASTLWPVSIPPSTALHALGAGAIGTMTLAVMTRATLGHTGRVLRADASTVAIYALVTAGALLRVAASWLPGGYSLALHSAGACWTAAFALFAWHYGSFLLAARIDVSPPRC
jgi:uncharacterized protein involved in response to NO